jgi:hypothetical protein
MVVFKVPLLVTTTGRVALDPIATGPKDRLAGLALTAWLLTPVPASSMASGDPLLMILIAPPVHTIADGVKLTFTSTLCPADSTSGRLNGEVANWGLFTVIAEMVTFVCPVLVTVMS